MVKVSFREGWVEDPGLTKLWVGLEEVVELMEEKEEEVVEEGTPGEAAEMVNRIPVEVEEVPSMLEKIKRMNVVTTQEAMVR